MNKPIQTVYTASEARDNLYKIVRQASVVPITIHLQGEEPADVVVMDKAEYDSMLETLDVMSNPEEVAAIKQAESETELISLHDIKHDLESE